MDFDIGNILYVVITLVAIIIGVLGKKKKPVNQEPGDSGEEAKPGFMENLERMLRMGQDNPQAVDYQDYEEESYMEESDPDTEPVAELLTDSIIPSRSIMDDYDRIMGGFNEFDNDVMYSGEDLQEEPLQVIDLDQEEGTNYFEIVQDFDAGTAVVYSTIINRLDY